ncbi:MAG: hypothetical protein ABSC16_12795 [Candidatus Dormibacteria bacterium]
MSAAPCTAGDMVASPLSELGVGLGSEYFGATVSLGSSSTCWLPGSPQATFANASGTPIVIAAISGAPLSQPVTLSAGTGPASIRVQISDYAALPPVAGISLTLGDGSNLGLRVAPAPSSDSAGVGPGPASEAVYVVGISVPAETATPTPAMTLSGVSAALHATSIAVPGQRYGFEVTLSNSALSPADLSPCPVYLEGLKDMDSSVVSYLLNCAAAEPIPSVGSESFDMRLSIPWSTPRGQYLLTWGIVGSASAYANTWIDVS